MIKNNNNQLIEITVGYCQKLLELVDFSLHHSQKLTGHFSDTLYNIQWQVHNINIKHRSIREQICSLTIDIRILVVDKLIESDYAISPR